VIDPRRVAFALWLALCFHGPLVLAGFYRYSYDAGTHEFFADHYLRSPFGLWEPRWFGGFSVSSYPPLVHQLMAALGTVTGVEIAFGAVLLATLVTLPYAVWRFAKIFLSPNVAVTTAIVSVFLPAFALTGHAFGQLPTLVALALTLLLAAEWMRYVERGERSTLLIVALLGGLAFTAHHATPVLFAPVVLLASFIAGVRRIDLRARLWRSLAATAAIASAGALAVFPFWSWSQTAMPHQIVIPHLSRANFLADADARSLFFWGMYGVLPAIALAGLRWADRRTLVLAAASVPLGVLGLGGTTALPSLLLGPGWEWLTYDRFALWTSVLLLPLAGLAVHNVALEGRRASRAAVVAVLVALGAFAAIDSATLLGTLPRQHDLRPLAAFLNADDRAEWRYQTFGFGDAATRLSYMTAATTIDGPYFTARAVPELQASGIGMLDYALWWDPSGTQLRRALAASDSYGIRWAFVAEPKYEPYLFEAGYRRIASRPDGVEIWENEAAPRVALSARAFGTPDPLGVMWGTVPLTLLACVILLMVIRQRRGTLVAAGRTHWTSPRLAPEPAPLSTRG
jgi:4-amino-4-deoxy-L-arabinose transferase-like glycosyltransferase